MYEKYIDLIDNGDFNDESSLQEFARSVKDKDNLLSLTSHYGSFIGGGYTAIPDDIDPNKTLLVKASDLLTREEIEYDFVKTVLLHKEKIKEKEELEKLKLKERNSHFMHSYQNSSEINPEDFMADVTDFINTLSNKRTKLSDTLIPVLCPSGHKHIVFLYHNGDVSEYSVTEHIPNAISKMISKIDQHETDNYEISYSTIPDNIYGEDIAAAVGIITESRNVIINDNSNVFIGGNKLKSYVSTVYGLTDSMLKNFLKNNSNITQYNNGGHIIYFKSEINRRIENDSKNGLFKRK